MEIHRIVQIDPVDLAEKTTGQPSTNIDVVMLALSIQAQKSDLLRKALVDNGDFLFSDKIERRFSLLSGRGWKPSGVLEVKKHLLRIAEEKAGSFYRESIECKLHVWSHSDGLIFVQDTHTIRQQDGSPHTYMGHGKIYFVWKPSSIQVRPMISYSGGPFSPTVARQDWRLETPTDIVIVGSANTCDGLFWMVEELKKKGTLLNQWPSGCFHEHFMMFQHEAEIHNSSSDWSKEGRKASQDKMVSRLKMLDDQCQHIANVS